MLMEILVCGSNEGHSEKEMRTGPNVALCSFSSLCTSDQVSLRPFRALYSGGRSGRPPVSAKGLLAARFVSSCRQETVRGEPFVCGR